MQSPHHFNYATLRGVPSSTDQPRIHHSFVGDLDALHPPIGVLVPQLTRQLRLLGLGSVTQYRFDVGTKRIRIGRRRLEGVAQVDVDLAEQRVQPIVHWTHRNGRVEIRAVSLGHLRSHEEVGIGQIQVGVSRSGYKNSIGPPESRDAVGWCSTHCPVSMLVTVGGTLNISSSLLTPSQDCRCTKAILSVEKVAWARCLPFTTSFRKTGWSYLCSSFYRSLSFPRGWSSGSQETTYQVFSGVGRPSFRRLFNVLACIPVLRALLPRAIAPRLMSGATLRSKPPNKLPCPCPLCTLAPTK